MCNKEDAKEKDDEPEKDEDGVEVPLGGERSLDECVHVEHNHIGRGGTAITGQTIQPVKKNYTNGTKANVFNLR